MTDNNDHSRRQFMKAATASTVASSALAGCTGILGGDESSGGEWRNEELATVTATSFDDLYQPDTVDSDPGTVNHLTWSGYDASNVQAPFRKKFSCDTSLDLFTSNPDAFARLDSGEWQDFHHATFDMAWLPNLAEAGLIRPLDYEQWKPYTFDKYTERFQKEEGYKYAFLNEDDYSFDVDGKMYGVPQRYGWASFAVNTNTVDSSDYSSYDAAWSEEYDVGIYDLPFWGVQIVMLREGIEPYKSHSEAEIEQIREATVDLFENATTVLSDIPSLNSALRNNEIDIGFISGSWINGSLRRGGDFQYQAHVPEEGSVIWVETTTMLKGDHPAVSDNYLAYMQHGITAKNLMWPTSGGTNVVPHQSAIDKLNRRQRDVLRVDDISEIIDRSVFYTGVPDLSRLISVWQDAKAQAQ